MEYKDYYKTLGIDRSASQAEIKKAYRRLARKYHPDLRPGDKAAEERFKGINEAYEVLGDAESRRRYDELGTRWKDFEQWQRTSGDASAWPFGWTPSVRETDRSRASSRAATAEELRDLFGDRAGPGEGSVFSDFFRFFFGGGPTGPQAQPRGRSAHRGQDVEQPLQVTLAEAYQGTQRLLQLQDSITGRVRQLEVKIPAGVETGSRVRLTGHGGPPSGRGQAGDLYLLIQVIPDRCFERKGDDLYTKVPIDLYTALLGGEVDVPTLSKRSLRLKIPPETQNGQTFALKGQGMPHLKAPHQRGDLYATVEVQLPANLSAQERKLFQALAGLRPKGR